MQNKIVLILALLGVFGCNISASSSGKTVSTVISSPPETTFSIDNGTNSCPMPTSWQVYFSPNGGATEAVVAEINASTESIYVQAYSFTSAPIAEALVAAKNRGLVVEILLDKSDKTGKGSQLPLFVSNHVHVLIDDKHAIAHNKIMILDHKVVLTGSFNFTNAAEHSNAENSIHLFSPALANKYLENWNVHQAHSVKPPAQ